jgi:hypothetical protein
VHRTARRKRFAGYRRVLNQYQKLGYVGAEIQFRAHDRLNCAPELGVHFRWTVRANRPGDLSILGGQVDRFGLRYLKIIHPTELRRDCVVLQETPESTGSAMQQVDLSGIKAEFEQNASAYAAEELGFMSGRIHAEVPEQYQLDVDRAIALAQEILDRKDRGWAPKCRHRAGLDGTCRFKRDVLLAFWRWLQALSIEETGSMLQVPEIVIRARSEA